MRAGLSDRGNSPVDAQGGLVAGRGLRWSSLGVLIPVFGYGAFAVVGFLILVWREDLEVLFFSVMDPAVARTIFVIPFLVSASIVPAHVRAALEDFRRLPVLYWRAVDGGVEISVRNRLFGFWRLDRLVIPAGTSIAVDLGARPGRRAGYYRHGDLISIRAGEARLLKATASCVGDDAVDEFAGVLRDHGIRMEVRRLSECSRYRRPVPRT